MPSNQKTFYHVQEQDYDRLKSAVRGKGWLFGPGDLIRSSDGMTVRTKFDHSVETLHVEVLETPKGQTYGSFFDGFWTALQTVSSNASTSP